MESTATDGSLMGLGVSRSVPSSPGERSPSDKFSLATCDHVSGSGDVSPSGPQLPPPYNNKSPGPMLRSSDQSPTGVQVPHINIWAHCDSEGGHGCVEQRPRHSGHVRSGLRLVRVLSPVHAGVSGISTLASSSSSVSHGSVTTIHDIAVSTSLAQTQTASTMASAWILH